MGRQDSMLGVLWRLEMKHLLRDRRALLIALVFPLVLLPILLWVARFSEQTRAEQVTEEPLRIAVRGPYAERLRGFLQDPKATDTADNDADTNPWREVTTADPMLALAEGDLDLVIEGHHFLPPQPSAAPSGSSAHESIARPGLSAEATPVVVLFFRADYEASNRALQTIEGRLEDARRKAQEAMLVSSGFRLRREQIFPVSETDVAEAGQAAGSRLGRWATSALLIFVLLGGSVVAGDALVGERERGTLETLLTSAAERRQILVAKLLAVLTFGGLVAVVQLLNLYVHATWGGLALSTATATATTTATATAAGWAMQLSLGRCLLVLILFVPLLALFSGSLLLISGRATSYREFHFYLLPLSVGLLLPTTAAALPNLQLQSGWALLPIANLSLVIRSVLAGHGFGLWGVVAWTITAAAAGWVVHTALRDLSTERQWIAAASSDRPPLRPFERHVVGWFVLFWAVIFLALANLPLLSGLIPQVLFTLVGVCLGGSLLLLWLYDLKPRQVLALRPTSSNVWWTVILLAPALAVVNGALFRWTSALFPFSRQALEAYGPAFGPTGLSFVEVLAVSALLPALCEEIAFRGVLLKGLQRRLPTLQLCAAVGFAFACFHFDLARFLPTWILGSALALVTVRSGSIYPAMLWHALNNGFVLALGYSGLPIFDLHPAVTVLGVTVSALCLGHLWRQSRAPQSMAT